MRSGVVLVLISLVGASGCLPDPTPLDGRACDRDADCGGGQTCLDGYCAMTEDEADAGDDSNGHVGGDTAQDRDLGDSGEEPDTSERDVDADAADVGDAAQDAPEDTSEPDGSADAGLQCGDGAECGGICVDLQTDPLHCGRCNLACIGNDDCVAGHCEADDGFVSIPAGTFMMGSPEEEQGRFPEAEQQHVVTLTRPFLMSRTEVTQAQWDAVMIRNPSLNAGCSNCPVDNVTWWETLSYANAMSRAEGLAECYDLSNCSGTEGISFECQAVFVHANEGIYACDGYRLPTEAEWEYAACAGTETAFYTGELSDTQITCALLDPSLGAAGWYCANSDHRSQEVAQKAANAFGLHDMHGNVSEWVWDDYREDYVFLGATDPVMHGTGWSAVTRGGSFADLPWSCRSAARTQGTSQDSYTGFRLVRTIP